MVQYAGRRDGFWVRPLGATARTAEAGGRFAVDMWPDVSDYDPEDLCEVPGLKMPDGSPARLYSAFRKGPVLLHFRWMRQYGIDGVFLSRFVGETASPARARHVNTVLANVREGCHREGRVWAMMLDLSMGRARRRRWSRMTGSSCATRSRFARTRATCTIRASRWCCSGGWGSRTAPGRRSRAKSWSISSRTIPNYGGVYLIGGIDPYWRTLSGESRTEPAWAKVYRIVRRHQPLGRRPVSRRRVDGPHPQARYGKATWPS